MSNHLKRARVSCACATCQHYCTRAAGWFLPSEIAPAAAHFGLTPEEFFSEHCTLDYWAGDTVFVIRPRLTKEAGGEMTSFDPRGRCAALQKGRCTMHDVKPYECAVTRHDIKDRPDGLHAAVADAWREPEAQAMIERLYGSTPVEPETDFSDMLSLMF